MPINDKQEAFCQNYCNNGFNASDAYRKIYKAKAGHNKLSARLMAKEGTKKRIVEIKALLAEKRDLSIKAQEIETLDIREKAKLAENYAAALSANEQINKHIGFYEADNKQKQEKTALDEQQRADQDDYNAWKRRQLLKPTNWPEDSNKDKDYIKWEKAHKQA